MEIVEGVGKQQWEPLIVFSFNRRDCERFAAATVTKLKDLSFNTEEESAAVEEVRGRGGCV